ncbi:AMP-binding protein, partial [Mycobacterium sp. 852002-51961_SCH5331710]|uniref:AMP-binding protein n=1 Tax=Mycobacterium sp. 852002-51961_SCH5331710 TaxID=1834105 RepID=UPI000A95A310
MADVLGLVQTLWRAGLIAPLRPDKYLRMGAAMRRVGMTATVGFAAAAQRCPDRPGLVDERGTLTWKQIDDRCDAVATGLQNLPGGTPKTVAVMCRNHRGFIESLVASNRIGADVLLLNTSFAGPALAEVVDREGADIVIYDEEFSEIVERAMADKPDATRILAWTDEAADGVTLDRLIESNLGKRPAAAERKSDIILLTSGTTGTP